MMRRTLAMLFVVLTAVVARGAEAPVIAESALDLAPLRYMSLQHNQTIKTFDTYAREVLFTVTGKSTLDKHAAAYSVLDMALAPRKYADRNIIYVRNKPFRAEFQELKFLPPEERTRIQKEGTLSLGTWLDPQMQSAMGDLMAKDNIKASAIREIMGAANRLAEVLDYPEYRGTLMTQAIVAPPDAPATNAREWQTLPSAGNHVLSHAGGEKHDHGDYPAAYTDAVEAMAGAAGDLSRGWTAGDATLVNRAVADLARGAEAANSAIYPSPAKRKFEVAYNSLYRFTLPGAFLYFIAFVLFLLAWRAGVPWTYTAAWATAVLAWLVHAFGIGVRWWLVEKSVGNWFESIPIKNQFESVLMSAFLGITIALTIEAVKRKRVFGVAASMVGLLSLVAIFAAPYISGRDIGGDIRQNAGILMTYWLYIHVVLVTCSYALIGMTFVMGTWYLIQYLANRHSSTLKTLDDCNLVLLQLAFWILGIGIITGALWADVSWGRPWGWDPKETFALVTWIVYLIIIHTRFITAGTRRGLATSVLSILGFFVMLFNWIGVNFFLVGL
ncbi:MAG TPA: cytochrome c biogenesis protein CcsA, partial [Tepidisphaeraceae bacterium]